VVEAIKNTLAQNSVDILTDCPSRERAGWLCDSYFTSFAEKIITGENLVEDNFLRCYEMFDKDDNLPSGMIPMCYPSDTQLGLYIPNWAMWFVLEIYQKYIREQFGFESEYDDENSVFTIKSNGVVNESLDLATAKQYVMENVDCVTVVLD
jgi:hypothetical protein